MDQQPNFTNSTPEQIANQHMLNIKSSKNMPSGPDPGLIEEISSVDRRLKLLENTLSNMRSKLENVEANQIDNNRDNRRDIRALEEENDELKKEIRDLKENMRIIITDLQTAAKEEDVKIIKGYLDLWNPVNFITVAQTKKVAQDVFEEMQEDLEEKKKGK
jgi:predicted RNase H-like nuclease (RuvC/YqgF family)